MATKALEGEKFEIHIDRGNVTGKTWHGDFRAKPVLSFAEQIRIDRLKRDLLGPGDQTAVDAEVLAQVTILAELQVRLTESPEWWAGGYQHADTNLLRAVYEAATKVRDDHFKALDEQGTKDQEALRVTKGPKKP